MSLAIVDATIFPNTQQIFEKKFSSSIFFTFQFLLDCAKVHGLSNSQRVVRESKRFPINRLAKIDAHTMLSDFSQYLGHKLRLPGLNFVHTIFWSIHYTIIQITLNSNITIMRRIDDNIQYYRESDKYQKNKNQPLNKKSYSQFSQKAKDKQLYELCQHLSHQNRLLKKENNQLKKLLQSENRDRIDTYAAQFQAKQYREANYESYKKKSTQLIASVKFLHKLYTQRSSLKKVDEVLEKFMTKIRTGKSNIVIELIRLFDQNIKQSQNIEWNVDEIERQSSKYQNQLLRKHIAKMNSILLQSVYQLKRDVQQVNQDIKANQQDINREINYYCQKYMNFGQKQIINVKEVTVQENKIKPISQISKGKTKKSNNKSKAQDQNYYTFKHSSQRMPKPKSKPLQTRNIIPNMVQKLSQSLAQLKSLNNQSVPLSNQRQSKPPKPTSLQKRQERTIADQLRSSNNTGKSSVTPKSRGSATKSHLKDSSLDYNFCFEGTPAWNSNNTSSRKYYR